MTFVFQLSNTAMSCRQVEDRQLASFPTARLACMCHPKGSKLIFVMQLVLHTCCRDSLLSLTWSRICKSLMHMKLELLADKVVATPDARASVGVEYGLMRKWGRLLSLLLCCRQRMRSNCASRHLRPGLSTHSRGSHVWPAAAPEEDQ